MTVLPLPVSQAPPPATYRGGRDAGSGRGDSSARGGDFASVLAAAGSTDGSKPAKSTYSKPVDRRVADSGAADGADQKLAGSETAATESEASPAEGGQVDAAGASAPTDLAAAQVAAVPAAQVVPVPTDLVIASAVPGAAEAAAQAGASGVGLPLAAAAGAAPVLLTATAVGTESAGPGPAPVPAVAATPVVPVADPGVAGGAAPVTSESGAPLAAGATAAPYADAAATGTASVAPGTPVSVPAAAVVRTAEAPALGTDGGLTVTIPASTSAPLDTAAEPAATSSSPSAPTTAPALPGVPAAAAGVATAPPAPVVSAAPVSAPAAVDPVALADQVLTTVTPLRRGPDGTHVLTMRLDPGHLGPVTVVAEVKGGAIRLELIAAVPAAQKALEQAAGDLRRDLADAGFGSASVDVRSGGPGDPRAGFAGGGDRSDGRSAQGSTRGADAGVGPAYESRGDRTADSQAVRYGPGGQRAVDVRV